MSAGSSRGRAWEATRRAVLDRDGHTCRICGEAEATEVDHVVPKAAGGTDDPANLQAACKPCNNRKSDSRQERVTWLDPDWFPPERNT